ncbi:MAG TPA: 30S ribosomal protein S11 [Candidatus Thalassarchaeaceae archaeon]|jgi:small subunit ribosomal protein S11|nr:30S ribosomal protein S11 [Candidatus Thalassarchaeaceae archaeon]|tara:strand:+ start:17456 stop:17845 length:390 start_codon:yes stop_codon:yes gene_type:complete
MSEMGHKAILHVFSTFNNVLITATDLTGAETICKVSGGMVTKGGSDSGGQFAATRAAEKIAEMLSEKEFDQVIVKYRGAGGNRSNSAPGATAAIRALTRAGMKITRIEDVTPTPTDGTKSKGGRRGRRV